MPFVALSFFADHRRCVRAHIGGTSPNLHHTPAGPSHVCSGRPGRPRKRPAKLHADKAHDSAEKRRALRARGITPRIARRGMDSRERLRRHRWVVERTFAWLLGCRRLGVRYERRADLLQGLLHLACAALPQVPRSG